MSHCSTADGHRCRKVLTVQTSGNPRSRVGQTAQCRASSRTVRLIERTEMLIERLRKSCYVLQPAPPRRPSLFRLVWRRARQVWAFMVGF